MQNLSHIVEELRLSQARRRGFESLHPLFSPQDVSSDSDLPLEEFHLSYGVEISAVNSPLGQDFFLSFVTKIDR